jgi:hypothetical protein
MKHCSTYLLQWKDKNMLHQKRRKDTIKLGG